MLTRSYVKAKSRPQSAVVLKEDPFVNKAGPPLPKPVEPRKQYENYLKPLSAARKTSETASSQAIKIYNQAIDKTNASSFVKSNYLKQQKQELKR